MRVFGVVILIVGLAHGFRGDLWHPKTLALEQFSSEAYDVENTPPVAKGLRPCSELMGNVCASFDSLGVTTREQETEEFVNRPGLSISERRIGTIRKTDGLWYEAVRCRSKEEEYRGSNDGYSRVLEYYTCREHQQRIESESHTFAKRPHSSGYATREEIEAAIRGPIAFNGLDEPCSPEKSAPYACVSITSSDSSECTCWARQNTKGMTREGP